MMFLFIADTTSSDTHLSTTTTTTTINTITFATWSIN